MPPSPLVAGVTAYIPIGYKPADYLPQKHTEEMSALLAACLNEVRACVETNLRNRHTNKWWAREQRDQSKRQTKNKGFKALFKQESPQSGRPVSQTVVVVLEQKHFVSPCTTDTSRPLYLESSLMLAQALPFPLCAIHPSSSHGNQTYIATAKSIAACL